MAPKSRSNYHHGDLRQQLLEHALDQIERGGLRAFSLRRCAAAAGVDVAAAYRHFHSKDELLAQVAQVGTYRLATRMERELGRARRRSPAEQMIALGRGYVAYALEQPQLYQATFSVRGQLDDKGPAQAGETGRTAYELLTDVLDALADTREVAASKRKHAETFAWSTLHGFVTLYQQGVLRLTRNELDLAVEQLCANVIDGLRP